MKMFIKKTIFLVFISALPAFSGLVSAAEISSETQILAEKINQIRSNPYEYAKKLGLDSLLLESRFYAASEEELDLNVTAIKPCAQIQEKAFYINNEISESISFPEYDASSLKGCLSFVITFNNYMEPETAVSIFVDDIFKREISPDYSGKRFILNFNYSLAGVDIKEGKVKELNAYYITVCFASSASVCEANMLNLINSVRNNPYLSDYYIFKHFPSADFYEFSLKGYDLVSQKPVFSSPDFHDTQIDNSAYRSEFTEAFEYYDGEFQNTYIEKAFAVFLIKELRDKKANPLIFNETLKSGTLSIKVFGEEGKKTPALYTFEGNIAKTPLDELGDNDFSKTYILIYKDMDNNSIFNPGEGVGDLMVILEDLHSGIKTDFEADSTGRIQLILPSEKTFNMSFEYENQKFEQILNTNLNGKYIEIKL